MVRLMVMQQAHPNEGRFGGFIRYESEFFGVLKATNKQVGASVSGTMSGLYPNAVMDRA